MAADIFDLDRAADERIGDEPCILFGMSAVAAENIGFVAMMLAALIVYTRFTKNRRK
ncbi:hypothetical protein [Paenibacillus barengoltzii]|uniref:hypothetical protein n=1 Tax=Paenibacillus barengoltzii TaxID=343517 RepID=UPI002FD94B54